MSNKSLSRKFAIQFLTNRGVILIITIMLCYTDNRQTLGVSHLQTILMTTTYQYLCGIYLIQLTLLFIIIVVCTIVIVYYSDFSEIGNLSYHIHEINDYKIALVVENCSLQTDIGRSFPWFRTLEKSYQKVRITPVAGS